MIALLRRRALLASTVLAGFLAAWTTEGSGFDPCPHHDGMPAPAAVKPAPDHSNHGGHHAAGPSESPDPEPGHAEEHGPCDCLGSCGVGTSPSLATATSSVASPTPGFTVHARPAPETRVSHRGVDLWSPYLPNAPPLPV